MKKIIYILVAVIIVESIVLIVLSQTSNHKVVKRNYDNELSQYFITREGEEFNNYREKIKNNPIDKAFDNKMEKYSLHMRDIIVSFTKIWKEEMNKSLASFYGHLNSEDLEYAKKAQENWEKQLEYQLGCEDIVSCSIDKQNQDLKGSDFHMMRENEIMEAYRERAIYIKGLEFELIGSVEFYFR